MLTRRSLTAAAAGLVLCACAPNSADVRLPAVFGDHMVLQRDQPIRIWGWAAAAEQLTVTLDRVSARAEADALGRWRVELPPQPAGGPVSLVVEGTNRRVLSDVLIGEVWLASGQSNMQMALQAAADSAREVAAADWPQLRLFTVSNQTALTPQEDVKGAWQVCTPQTAGPFSAVAYFFGRQLHRELGVPVGLISSSWGGTIIETWTDRASLEAAGLEAQRLADLDRAREHLPELQAAQRAATEALVQELANDSLAAPGVADGDWATLTAPTQWEQAGLPGFNGLVWFRRTVQIPAAWSGKDLVLRLGPVDEVDDTFFNGTRVGGMGSFADGVVEYWDDPRAYVVPGRLVHAGVNALALRVVDTMGAGGLWGAPAEAMVLSPAGAASGGGDTVSVAGAWRYHPGPRLVEVPSLDNPNQPALLYNAMVHPLRGLGLRGVIWYQGEGNLNLGLQYEQRLRLLIGGWRRQWGIGDFAFELVQLAPFRYAPAYAPDPSLLSQVWEAQRRVLAMPNTGMAVTIDIGDLADIHPRNKQEVRRRLALWALARTYGRDGLVYSGPLVTRAVAEAEALRLHFDQIGSGLAARDGQDLSWFELAGADSVFRPALARIDGSTVVLTSPQVAVPVQARLAWSQDATPNLTNREGLPASPFWIAVR